MSKGLPAKHGKRRWTGWQEHMESLIGRLDTLLASQEDRIELIPPQMQENEAVMR